MASVSIVLLTRNRPQELAQTLERVAKQTHLELELVLVRDGGEPLSDAVVERIDALEFPTQRIEHDDPAEGIARSRNRGVEAARADAVAFLDDDDLWEPGHVGRLAAALDRDAKTDVVYTDAWVANVESGQRRALAREFDLKVFGRDGFIPPSAMLARRDAFPRFGLFDPELTYSEDWDWLLRVARGKGLIERLPGASVTVRIHAGGMSALHPDRLNERRRCLEILSKRHGLAPIQPKTFWEVAETLCPDGNVSTR
jgi:GT2 family glycosyltransferase